MLQLCTYANFYAILWLHENKKVKIMELDYKAIGKRIKIARIRAEMTQEKLSEIAGVSPTHLSNIETGTTRVSLCTLIILQTL